VLLRKGLVTSSETRQPAAGGDELETFSREVLEELAKDGLPPFPSYFQMYFEKLLDEKPYEFRKSVSEMIESESNTEDEKQMRMEQQLQDGFAVFKEILQNVAALFKNVSNMTQVAKRRAQESKAINNPSAVQNLALALNNDLEKLISVLNAQAAAIKNLYTKSAKIIQEVNGETIYDAQYGIFNKRYLGEQITLEIARMGKFHHQSTLIMAKLNSKIRAQISSDKQLALINRTISKLFMKTSRRSDVVAHFGGGCFAMLLKHTDEANAVRAAQRVADMTSGSHFFIADREIKLEIALGIAALSVDQNAETVMVRSLDALEAADGAASVYSIAQKESAVDTAGSTLSR
jgi:diguanylate cyclase (GGDEF)-like protein